MENKKHCFIEGKRPCTMKCRASYKDGVLIVRLPKSENRKTGEIKVELEQPVHEQTVSYIGQNIGPGRRSPYDICGKQNMEKGIEMIFCVSPDAYHKIHGYSPEKTRQLFHELKNIGIGGININVGNKGSEGYPEWLVYLKNMADYAGEFGFCMSMHAPI